MTARRPALKKQRCLECTELAESLVLGRCPRCQRVATALESDWRVDQLLVRTFQRHDGCRLTLVLRRSEDTFWSLEAAETVEKGEEALHEARLGRYRVLGAAIAFAERFGRRWLEKTPGTSIATYVPRPDG